ncbi:MAG: phenylpyruvate tautomerase MIF-related protein [Oscillibacter sp.]|nr:phenylpyruvate tautomerase MIF-related protein [Oscillibacter sp.]MEA4993339.1 phenylpyruvate tautomerase MIF-related protein [Oscillibacter sp.]
MPYIGINTSKSLSDPQKDALKTALGAKISLIPGKSESKLMVDISDGRTMYLAGEKRELAYVDVKCFGAGEFAHKKVFTEAAFEVVQQTTGLPQDGIYLTYSEFENWGTQGTMK